MGNNFFRTKRIRAQMKKFASLVFLLLALLFIVADYQGARWTGIVRSAVAPIAMPFMRLMRWPVVWVQQKTLAVKEIFSVYQDNQTLKTENQKLHQKLAMMAQLDLENMRLKKQWNYIAFPMKNVISTHLILREPGDLNQTVLIPVGHKSGVQRGNIVLSNQGVLGRVLNTGPNYSRILMLTDFNSKVPVMVGDKRILALAQGIGETDVLLTALPEEAPIATGDMVLTSGYGGVFPAGLMIGHVKSVNDKEIMVQLAAPVEKIDIVQVVDFGLEGLIERDMK